MNIRHTPNTVAAPFGPYSHAAEVPEGSRLLYISGEVGVLPDGRVPSGIEAQAEACWRNIIAILADARMEIGDLVKITTYLVRPEDIAAAGAARATHLGDARPGSATIIVKALVRPEWLIEIEAVAATKASGKPSDRPPTSRSDRGTGGPANPRYRISSGYWCRRRAGHCHR